MAALLPSSDHARLASGIAAATATTGAALYLTRKLTTVERMEINSLEELQAYEGRSLAARLLTGPARTCAVRLRGAGALTELPASVLGMGPRLVELDLSGCSLTSLPDSLGRLARLRTLRLGGNRLTTLPESLGRLAGLEDLDVSNNALTALPDTIGSLLSLRYLNAMGNRLVTLPDSIGQLANLSRLGLKSNALTTLPDSVGDLTSLVELFITDNKLEALPASMGRLTSLVKLQASFNNFKRLPSELAELPNLELLRVACCALEKCPVALKGVPRLAWFSISGNPCVPVKTPRSRVPTADIKELEIGRKLGDGASGEVFEAVWKGKRVALKLFRQDRSPDGHSRDEMAMAIALQGDANLIHVLAQVQQPLGLVMEYCEGRPLAEKPNLDSLLRCRWAPDAAFTLPFLLRVAAGLAGALEHMHYRGICHGDVYAHNLLVDPDASSVILCDYGAAFPYSKGLPLLGGLAAYEAGEVRAFGLLLADMVARLEMSFEGMDVLIDCQRELLQLIQLCTAAAPAKRPCFGAVGKKLRAVQRQLDKGLKDTPRGYADSVRSMHSDRDGEMAAGYQTPRSGTARSVAETDASL